MRSTIAGLGALAARSVLPLLVALALSILAPPAGASPAPARDREAHREERGTPEFTSGVPEDAERRRVVAGERYRASGLHRLLFGREYRDLWTLPVELPVLDLETFAGGLRPVRRVGHGQSKALAMRGENGVAYTFRPVIKDPSGLLPVELRETFAKDIVQDQMASGHPAGHVIVPALLDAVGVLHNTPRLVVMPDDPALGEFREDFRGLVGDIEEFTGQKGFGGSLEVIDGEEMWKRLQASPEVRADPRAFLTARLVDHLIGDWDRHRNQWNWARMPDKPLWQPIPEDRDQAFVRFQGLAISLIRPQLPLLVDFGPKYPSLHGLTFDGWDVDRRLLADLEKPAWNEIAASVKGQLTDAVIEAAVRRMPAEYFAKEGPGLVAALKRRRDRIPEQAERFYRFLAGKVDVRCTDQSEVVEIVRAGSGDVEVSVALAPAPGDPAPAPYFRRRFHPGETREIRVYLYGGDDRAVVRGPGGGIVLRVVGGEGNDTVDDSAGGGARVYDSSGDDRVVKGSGTGWDRQPYTPPVNPSADWFPPKDWGRRTIFALRVTGSPDLGAFVSAGISSKGYAFRKDPHGDHQRLRVGYATLAKQVRAQYDGEWYLENSKLRLNLHARASGIDILRFYGFGNQTPSADPDSIFKLEQDLFVLAPSLTVPLASRLELNFGLVAKYATKTEPRDNPVLAAERVYGAGDFGEAGATARLDLDTTDRPGLPKKGLLFSAGGSFYPALWDVKSAYGEAHGQAMTFLSASIPLEPTLVLKGGGKRVWGTSPFFESAFLGGGHTFAGAGLEDGNSAVRGLRQQRYAGDGSLFGSAELRLSVTRLFLFVPGELGVFGLGDAGRVYLAGESSDRWHTSLGGGIYFASPERRNAVTIAVAKSEGRTGAYLRVGLAF